MVPSYPSTYHWPASLTVHRDDHYISDPTVFLDCDVVITEKLDGGVATICEGKAYARSSFAPTSLPWFDYMKAKTVPKLYGTSPVICAIGEDLYGVHSIEYDPLPDTFFLFHVLERRQENVGTEHTEGDLFWDWPAVVAFAKNNDLRHVPVLFEGSFTKVEQITEWFHDNIGLPSLLGPVREGFVLRVRHEFWFDDFALNTTKFVRKNHVQTDEHWTKHWKPARLIK